MNTLAAAALFLTLLTAGCGDADAKSLITDGHTSLGSGDAQAALEHFQAALCQLTHEDADFIEAKLGEIEALIAVDATKSKDEFLALAKAYPDRIDQAKYIDIGGKMANGNRFLEAIELTHAGIQRFGQDSTKLKDRIDHIKKVAQASGDKDVLGALRNLGYVN